MDLSYLTKFNALPKEIKDAVNAPEAGARLNELAAEYKIDLATTVMRVMVRDIKLDALGAYLINTLGLSADSARTLEQKLRRSIFAPVIDYLLGADKGPKLIFDESDERDARAKPVPKTEADFDKEIDTAVETIAAQSRINFSDPLTGGKFRQVMKTYLRGTRDKIAVAEALTKAAELGGVALGRDTAERVLIIAGNFLTKHQPLPSPNRISVAPESSVAPLAKKPPVVHAEYDFEQSLREQGKLKATNPVPKPPRAVPQNEKPDIFKRINLDLSHELMPPVPALIPGQAVSTNASAVSKVSTKPKLPTTRVAPVPHPTLAQTPRKIIKEAIGGQPLNKERLRSLASVDNTLKSATGKVRMDDIRFSAQAQSPVDEMKAFNLIAFRRLDPDPLKAIEKIREKIETLGREEYSRKIEAIVAWQQSPLNRLYLSVCRRGMDEGIPLQSVLEREAKKEPAFLRSDELSAIITLNRSLKF